MVVGVVVMVPGGSRGLVVGMVIVGVDVVGVLSPLLPVPSLLILIIVAHILLLIPSNFSVRGTSTTPTLSQIILLSSGGEFCSRIVVVLVMARRSLSSVVVMVILNMITSLVTIWRVLMIVFICVPLRVYWWSSIMVIVIPLHLMTLVNPSISTNLFLLLLKSHLLLPQLACLLLLPMIVCLPILNLLSRFLCLISPLMQVRFLAHATILILQLAACAQGVEEVGFFVSGWIVLGR